MSSTGRDMKALGSDAANPKMRFGTVFDMAAPGAALCGALRRKATA